MSNLTKEIEELREKYRLVLHELGQAQSEIVRLVGEIDGMKKYK